MNTKWKYLETENLKRKEKEILGLKNTTTKMTNSPDRTI